MEYIFQVSWFLDSTPEYLGPFLIAIGLLITTATFLTTAIRGSDSLGSLVGVFIVALIGSGIVGIWVFQRYTFLFAALMLLAGRWIEGVAATRFLSTLVRFFSLNSSQSGDLVAKIVRRLKYALLIGFITVVAGWIALGVIMFGPVTKTYAYELAVVWTVYVGLLSLLGLVWKFRRVDNEVYKRVPFVLPSLVGLILAVTGSQLYNFKIMQSQIQVGDIQASVSAVEPMLLILGTFVYIIAYMWSASKRLSQFSG